MQASAAIAEVYAGRGSDGMMKGTFVIFFNFWRSFERSCKSTLKSNTHINWRQFLTGAKGSVGVLWMVLTKG